MKNRLKKLFGLPIKTIVLLDLAAFPLVIASLKFLSSTDPISIAAYLLSAYALAVTVVNFKKLIRRAKEISVGDELRLLVWLRELLHKNKYTGLYLDSKAFRAEVALYVGLAFNLFFATFKVMSGIHDDSIWLISIGFYYLALAAVRFMLMYGVRNKRHTESEAARKYHEYKTYRRCGVMMMFLNLTIAGISVQMIWQNRVNPSSQTAVIVTATYTFYFFITGIINIISFRKSDNAVLLAAKDLAMTGAILSMFTLQNTMLHTFGGAEDEDFRIIMNTVTGGFVLVLTLGLALFMIVNGTKKMKYYKSVN